MYFHAKLTHSNYQLGFLTIIDIFDNNFWFYSRVICKAVALRSKGWGLEGGIEVQKDARFCVQLHTLNQLKIGGSQIITHAKNMTEHQLLVFVGLKI